MASDDLMMRTFRDSIEGITGSSVFMQLFHPSMVTDWEGAALPLFELGAALMLDKPLVVLVDARDPIPERLRRAADRIIEIDGLRGPGGPEAASDLIAEALRELTP